MVVRGYRSWLFSLSLTFAREYKISIFQVELFLKVKCLETRVQKTHHRRWMSYILYVYVSLCERQKAPVASAHLRHQFIFKKQPFLFFSSFTRAESGHFICKIKKKVCQFSSHLAKYSMSWPENSTTASIRTTLVSISCTDLSGFKPPHWNEVRSAKTN